MYNTPTQLCIYMVTLANTVKRQSCTHVDIQAALRADPLHDPQTDKHISPQAARPLSRELVLNRNRARANRA